MKRCGGDVSVAVLKPMIEALGRMGMEIEKPLRDAQIDRAVFGDAAGRVSLERLCEFWKSVPLAAGDQTIGLRVADFIDFGSFDVYWYIAKSSATGGDALRRGQRYVPLFTDHLSLELRLEGERAVVQYVHLSPVSRIISDFVMALSVRVGRELCRPRKYPLLEVRLSYALDPVEAAKYAAYFDVPVRFGCGYDALVVPAGLLEMRRQDADEQLCRILERQAERESTWLLAPGDLAARVRRLLTAQLQSGEVSMEVIAKRLGKSPRTLRRKLHEEGMSYARLLEELRHRLALEHLDQGRTVGEVASLLGYTDIGAFSKAFRRWTGVRPTRREREQTGQRERDARSGAEVASASTCR